MIYRQHWGMEQSRLRYKHYRAQKLKNLMHRIFIFVIVELEEYCAQEDQIFNLVRYLPLRPHYGDYRQWQLSRLDRLGNLLFPIPMPYRISRENTGTLSEHENRQRQQFCLLHNLKHENIIGYSIDTISRVNAFIGLAPLNRYLLNNF